MSDKKFWERLIQEALNNKAEYNYLDFKLDLSNHNERLKEHINAFGNLERGGCFIFGVKNFIPVGLQEDSDKIIQKITHLATSTQIPSLHIDAFPLTYDGQQLLCIHILPGASKPVFIKDRAPAPKLSSIEECHAIIDALWTFCGNLKKEVALLKQEALILKQEGADLKKGYLRPILRNVS